FGISGTNVHVVLEQAPGPVPVSGAGSGVGVREGGGETALDTDLVVWAFSAHTRSALQARAADLAELAEQAGTDLADVAHALDATVGSSAQRAVVLADDPAALAARLR